MPVQEGLTARLKEKYPLLDCFADRSFGVEIEFYGLDYFITPVDEGIIKPYNIRSCARNGQRFDSLLANRHLHLGTDREHWHLEEDSSIMHRGGVELVSPILRGLSDLITVYRFLQLLGAVDGVAIDESCGFHVHHGVDRSRYNCKNLRELIRIVYPLEDYMYLLIPGERLHRSTCRPMEVDVEKIFQNGSCDIECQAGCRLKSLWYSLENRCKPIASDSERYDKTRYHGLNLHSYWYRSTVEFRYHSAVLQDIDEAMQWIIFTQFLVELSAGHTPDIPYHPKANKWLQTIYKIYMVFGRLNQIQRPAG